MRRSKRNTTYALSTNNFSDTFGITAGPPLHDPIAVAAVLIGTESEIPFFEWDAKHSQPPEHNERFEVTVITEGTFDEAREGKQTGRTLAKLLPPGEQGVRIPRGVDTAKFWQVIEECIERADAKNAALASAN
jgi:uridine nucleosidase